MNAAARGRFRATTARRMLARELLKAARRPWGDAWVLLTPEHRDALICQQIVSIVLGQADETLARNPALARIVEVAKLATEGDP